MTTNDKVKKIHECSLKILNELGIDIHSESVCQLLKDNGFKVEGRIAFFTEEQVMAALATVPSEFTLKARNPKYDMNISTTSRYYACGYGCPNVIDADGTTRSASREDYIKFVKMLESCDTFNINGGIAVQPYEINAEDAPLVALNDTVTHSEKCIMTMPNHGGTMQHVMNMLEMVFGVEDLKANHRCLTLINTTSPLGLDGKALETIQVCCKYNQPVVITPGPMCGTTSPITMTGTIAMGNAEALAAIVIAQLINKGNPLVYGMLINPVNMKNAATNLGSPAYQIMHKYSTELAHFYNMPSRTGGPQSDAAKVGVQSGFESGFSLATTALHGTNLIIHSAGVLNSFESMSYEKFVCDVEVISKVEYYMNDIEVNDETLLFDEIKEVGHGGHFLYEDSTLELSRTYPWYGKISVNEFLEDTATYDEVLNNNISKRISEIFDAYVQPELDVAIKAKLDEYVNANGVKKYF